MDHQVVDCNTCRHHKQGEHPPKACQECLDISSLGGRLYLPYWEPKMKSSDETIELTDVSPHAVVTDYKPNPVLHTMAHKSPCQNNQTCDCPPAKCNGASDTSGRCKATIPVPIMPIIKIDTKTGTKHDSGKPPMDLLDRVALEETARVLAFGAKKYAAHNWRKGLPLSRTCAAALRHIYQFLDGETNDAETGLNHLGHAMCEIMFALNASKTRPDLDDRYGAIREGA